MIQELLTVLFLQMFFIMVIDLKVRHLKKSGEIKEQLFYQLLLSSSYVVIMPLVAVGSIHSAIAYIVGAVAGNYISYKIDLKRG